jgi:hypothetical protein
MIRLSGGHPPPGRLVGPMGVGHPQGVFGGLISDIIFQHCPPDRGIHLKDSWASGIDCRFRVESWKTH